MKGISLLLTLLLAACSSAGKHPAGDTADDARIADAIPDGRTAPDLPPGVDGTDAPGLDLADAATTDAPLPDLPQADTVQPEPPTPTDFAGRVQVIQRMESSGPASGSVAANLQAAPLPTTQVIVEEAGDCKLLVGDPMMPWNCDKECAWGEEVCINNECLPHPTLPPSGDIVIRRLDEEGTHTPAPMGYYDSAWGLSPTLFEPGKPVTATSTGGDTPAFALTAYGVEPLVASPDAWDFVPGEDYTVTWTAGSGKARIQLLLQTGWHGSPNLTTIWCETDDDGEITVPASLTEDFPIPSCGECEGSYISRFTRDLVDFGNGPIELFVASQYWFVAWW